jgi:hypothetical protein
MGVSRQMKPNGKHQFGVELRRIEEPQWSERDFLWRRGTVVV